LAGEIREAFEGCAYITVEGTFPSLTNLGYLLPLASANGKKAQIIIWALALFAVNSIKVLNSILKNVAKAN
jgi:hypothetical protein